MSENLKDDVIQAVRKGNCPDYMQNSHACFGCPYGELGETTYICINTRYDKTDIDILDAKIVGVDLAKEYPCTKCIHHKPCEEAYDMDLGDNYQYCPYYDDGKEHQNKDKQIISVRLLREYKILSDGKTYELLDRAANSIEYLQKRNQEYQDFLEALSDFLIWDTGKCAREARYKIEAFLKRMGNKHDGT